MIWVKGILYGVLGIAGIASLIINLSRITQGCPEGQILIKSVSVYECINR